MVKFDFVSSVSYDKVFNSTSERKLVRVGFTKSVVVTRTFEEKERSITWSFGRILCATVLFVSELSCREGDSQTQGFHQPSQSEFLEIKA